MIAWAASLGCGTKIPFGALEKTPRMSPEQHAQLIARNQVRYAAAQTGPSDATEPDDALVRLHRPDLPWKLEKDSGSEQARKNPDNLSSDAAEKW
jgi:hypothetical protein